MLKEAGVEASPALIGVRRASLVEGFPAWSFNHMIVAAGVGEDRIWIDPTSQFLPLGQLPGACQATDALLLNDDGTSTISRTPEERGWASSTHYDLQVFVLGTADAQFELGIQMEGQAAASARRALWGADEKATLEFCHDLLAGEFVDAEQISAKVRNLEEVAPGSPTVASSRCWAEANSERPRSFGSAPDTVRRMRTRPCARSRVGSTIARTRRSCCNVGPAERTLRDGLRFMARSLTYRARPVSTLSGEGGGAFLRPEKYRWKSGSGRRRSEAALLRSSVRPT